MDKGAVCSPVLHSLVDKRDHLLAAGHWPRMEGVGKVREGIQQQQIIGLYNYSSAIIQACIKVKIFFFQS